ncbi:hypothetical protein OAE53_01075 [bacterium]|nr:hypothetical protein [bacterium]
MIRQLLNLGLIVIPTTIPIGAIAGAPELALKKARAVGQASAAMCLVNNGKLSEQDSLNLLLSQMKKAGISSVLPWLKTKEGTKAIQIASTYFESDCQTIDDPKGMTRAIMHYVL